MQEPITINYTRDGDDWKLTATRAEEELSASATGLIAARDKADQLVEKLAAGEGEKTVVHLLDGDAFAFTDAYLHARLTTGTGAAAEPAASEPAESTSTQVNGAAKVNGKASATESAPAGDSGKAPAPAAEPEADVAEAK
ncbi:hypothetical protein [Sciscionella sediminilitoris]|uniref:hypothetical protein n=1 Tax=Sciscionella sediminilitoris TaxID=1445613 RepID=UPI00055CB3ED|nr:hypothetical protein [Sciscionella sp. SE31]